MYNNLNTNKGSIEINKDNVNLKTSKFNLNINYQENNNLTLPEKRDDLRAFFIGMEDARELLKEYNKENPKATYLAIETIKVLDEYENLNLN